MSKKSESKRKTKSELDRLQRKGIIENNKKFRQTQEIVDTLKAMKPICQDSLYKEGWDDCVYLFQRAIKRLDF